MAIPGKDISEVSTREEAVCTTSVELLLQVILLRIVELEVPDSAWPNIFLLSDFVFY
jgi:hypothetical protein